MNALRGVLAAAILSHASGLVSSCTANPGQLGSETNWLERCKPGDHCAQGTCLCGICTTLCTNDRDCGARPSAICVTPQHAAYGSLCEGTLSAPTNLCARTCVTGAECGAAEACVSGACVPPAAHASSSPEASTATDADAAPGPQKSDAAPDDGAPLDARTDGGVWPPSIAPTSRECAPDCDGAACGGACGSDWPCDTGCCGNASALETVSTDSAAAPFFGTTVAVDSSGGLHYAYVDTEVFYYEKGPSAWTGGGPDAAGLVNGAGPVVARAPRLAVGKQGGADRMYLVYRLTPSGSSSAKEGGRFGAKSGGSWTFETLPAVPLALAVDTSGAALVLTSDGVLQRNAANGWDTLGLPSPLPGTPRDLTVDSTGAWYVAASGASNVSVSRRSPAGQWVTEVVVAAPGASLVRVRAGGDAVHVGYQTGDGVHYARRVGTAWVDHLVSDQVGDFAMAIGACGSPEFVVYGGGTGRHQTIYERWTSRGWRSQELAPAGCDLGQGVGVALTSSSAHLSFFNCGYIVVTIPLQ